MVNKFEPNDAADDDGEKILAREETPAHQVGKLDDIKERNQRKAKVCRKTHETDITIQVNLDGQGKFQGNEQIPFLEHLLHQLARHSLIDIQLQMQGDLAIDDHHSTEDCALVLGQALNQALQDKRGIFRYGYATLPMDEALATVSIDLGGRSYFSFTQENSVQKPFSCGSIGSYNAELTCEFLQKLAGAVNMNLHIILHRGGNLHHMHEIVFKTLGKCLQMAVRIDPQQADQIPSTKGSL